MWFILAFAAFLAGQIYLFRCLGKLDSLLAGKPGKREVLNLAFAEPAIAEQLACLLETFSRENPGVDLVLHTDAQTPAAVAENRAAVGFCGEDTELPGCLDALTLCFPGVPARKMIWKTGTQTAAARAFTRFLWRSSGN